MTMFAIPLALAIASQSPTGGPEAWKEVVSKQGGFAVKMPGSPTQRVQEQKTPTGTLSMPMVLSKVGDLTYIAMKLTPPAPVSKAQAGTFFDGVKASFTKDSNNANVKESRGSVAAGPSAEFTYKMTLPDGSGAKMDVRSLFILAGPAEVFSLQVLAPVGRSVPKDIEAFFGSFRKVKGVELAAVGMSPPAGGPKAPGPDLKWSTFTSASAGLSIKLPGKPKEQTKSQDTPAGKVDFTVYMVEIPDAAFTATCYSFPQKVADQDPATTLDNLCKGTAAGTKGTILEIEPAELGDLSGRSFTFEFPGPGPGPEKGLGRGRAFLVGRKAYLVMAVGSTERMKAADVDSFLESFKLTTGPAAKSKAAGPRPAMPGRTRPGTAKRPKAGGNN